MIASSDTQIIKNWWDEVSQWYEHNTIPVDVAHYGPFAPTEDDLKLLGAVKGKRILEIGCGGAQNSIAFAKQGAICCGVDLSSGQLQKAKRLCEESEVSVELIEGNMESLDCVAGREFDIVYSAYALQYVQDLGRCFSNVFSLLSPSGLFVFSCHHPFADCVDAESLRLTTSYHTLGRIEYEDKWPDGSSRTFIKYERRISDYHNSLVDAGFLVERILEPLDLTRKEWSDQTSRRLSELVGPTIIFKSRKG